MDPNWHFTPFLLIILNNYPQMMLLYILLHISISVSPLQFWGQRYCLFWVQELLGLHEIHLGHLGYSRIDCRITEARRDFLSSVFNTLGGTPFSPGALLFANFVVDFLISYHEMG